MASIKCGKCKGAHATIADVRTCHESSGTVTQRVAQRQAAFGTSQQASAPSLASALEERQYDAAIAQADRQDEERAQASKAHRSWFDVTGQRPVATAFLATEKQVAYLRSLLEQRDVPADQVATVEELLGGPLTKAQASLWIEALKETPRKAQPATTTAAPRVEDHFTVAEGYYATASRTGNNDLDFWRVSHGKGRWAGRTFVQRVIGGKADQNVRGAEAQQALAAIVADDQAAARYGQEIGRCCACNRHLTDETSRALGIGPDCRTK